MLLKLNEFLSLNPPCDTKNRGTMIFLYSAKFSIKSIVSCTSSSVSPGSPSISVDTGTQLLSDNIWNAFSTICGQSSGLYGLTLPPYYF